MAVRIHNSNGYMGLTVWVLNNVIQLATESFCDRFLDLKNDPCGRQRDQMVQAARSAVALIKIITSSQRKHYEIINQM